MKKKPEIDQVLYSKNIGNAARYGAQYLKKVIVKKVGRKYFTCGENGCPPHMDSQYHLSDWRQKSDFSACSYLYKSAQEWEDEKEIRKICVRIYKLFENSRNKADLSLAILRKIDSILNGVK
jgi:hypothetical protein